MGNDYDFRKSRIRERIQELLEEKSGLRKKDRVAVDSGVTGDNLRIACKVTYTELKGLDPEIWREGSEEVEIECDPSWTLDAIRDAAVVEAWPKTGTELDDGTYEIDFAYDAVWVPISIEFSTILPRPDWD
ncbi:MAG: hypothetical protein OXE05_09070 [Chloroflexi bacterium]|nr:hypothetical protein [Chloroflexota bacterium]